MLAGRRSLYAPRLCGSGGEGTPPDLGTHRERLGLEEDLELLKITPFLRRENLTGSIEYGPPAAPGPFNGTWAVWDTCLTSLC